MQLKNPGFEAAHLSHLIFHTCQVTEDIPDAFEVFFEGR
jgi:hypothetical protein